MEPVNENVDRLSEKQLKWGLWWLKNQLFFKRTAIGLLAVVAFSLLAYGSWGFADWYFGSGVGERAGMALLTQNLTDYTRFRELSKPNPLTVQPSLVLGAGSSKYDLLSKITNSNAQWWVEFEYRFTDVGLTDQVKHGYLLPGDSRYFYQLGLELKSRPAPNFEIINLSWHRVDGHKIQPSYLVWATERLDFTVADPEFVPPDTGLVLPISRARFSVTNNTAFGYVSVPFFVTLLSGEKIVAANRVVISRFESGETRQVEASWFHDLPSVTRVEVRPELNLFDSSTYLEPST